MSDNAFPSLPIVQVKPLAFINVPELQSKTEADQKQFIGELIHPFVSMTYGPDAPKITGMLLTAPISALISYCQNADLFFFAAQTAN